MTRPAVIVPCYNEAKRLDVRAFSDWIDDGFVDVWFVDDGSKDRTREVLAGLVAGGRAHLVVLDQNRGKAEAVRQGLLAATAAGAEIVGYLDADLATGVDEMAHLLATLDVEGADVVLGSRVRLLGRAIARRPERHYLGRVFATAASLTLGLAVYDTQCGAKALRVGEPLRAALAEPFLAGWVFDVELLGRMLVAGLPPEKVVEVPLRAWRDVAGSKVKATDFPRAFLQLRVIAVDLRRRRALSPPTPSIPPATSGSRRG